jgi:hypothetical protein
MKPRRRLASKLGIGLAVLLAIAVGAHTLAWRWATRQLETEFALAMAQRRAFGWTVRHDAPVRSGWPLAAQLRVPGLALAYDGPDLPGGLSWSTERLLLTLSPLHPRTLRLRADGQQSLRLAGSPDIPFTADRCVLSLTLEPGVPPREFQLDVENLRAGIPVAAGGSAALEVAHLSGHAETRPAAAQGEPVFSFTADADSIFLPQPAGTAWALGRGIASLSVEGALNGPWPRVTPLVQRIATWRDGGGSLEIRRIAGIWGPLDLGASATLALDEHMQPMGAASARVTGQAETLDALAGAQVITPGVAKTAKVLLALMAHPPEGGGRPMVEVPLTLQQRSLNMGRIPLARLPEMIWPSDP